MRPYRAYTPDQAFLLPPALGDLLSEDDPVFFLRDVLGKLDLSAFHEAYRCERSQPPYHRALMLGIYFYGAMRRLYSSRKLADACRRDIGFMVLTGRTTPDFHTISEFRQRFTDELAGLFVQVLRLCQDAGLIRLGHIALRRYHRDEPPDADPAPKRSSSRWPHRNEMRRRLLSPEGKELYKKRKQTVEPVFGQIKGARSFRQFLRRGLRNVGAEWAMLCTVHNLLKRHQASLGA